MKELPMSPITKGFSNLLAALKHYGTIAALIAGCLDLILIVVYFCHKQTTITAVLISFIPAYLLCLAGYSFRTMNFDAPITAPANVPSGGIAWAESYFERRRSEYTDMGAQLTALLNIVGSGAGIIAIAGTAIQTGPVATALNAVAAHAPSNTNTANVVAPLNVAAALSLSVVLAICLVALAPRNHPESGFSSDFKDLTESKYVKCLLETAEKYETRRRMRRRLYIFAGSCLVIAIGSIFLNLFTK
jgi:hypothetical protein